MSAYPRESIIEHPGFHLVPEYICKMHIYNAYINVPLLSNISFKNNFVTLGQSIRSLLDFLVLEKTQ